MSQCVAAVICHLSSVMFVGVIPFYPDLIYLNFIQIAPYKPGCSFSIYQIIQVIRSAFDIIYLFTLF